MGKRQPTMFPDRESDTEAIEALEGPRNCHPARSGLRPSGSGPPAERSRCLQTHFFQRAEAAKIRAFA